MTRHRADFGTPASWDYDGGRTRGYALAGIVDPRGLAGLAQALAGAPINFEPPAS